jgi:hypothetical protein
VFFHVSNADGRAVPKELLARPSSTPEMSLGLETEEFGTVYYRRVSEPASTQPKPRLPQPGDR